MTADQPSSHRAEEVASLFDGVRQTFASIPVMSVADCREQAAAGTIVVVDTRGEHERAVSIIPGALCREEYEADRDAWAGKPVVCYCTMGYRSGLYAKKLAAKGVDARLLDGALLGWVHAGLPVECAEGETRRVHVFNEKFDLLPDGYESVR